MQIYLTTCETGNGHTDSRVKCRLAVRAALLIELKAQFYKSVLYTVGGAALCGTMHQLVKRSIRVVKVDICYIDSECEISVDKKVLQYMR